MLDIGAVRLHSVNAHLKIAAQGVVQILARGGPMSCPHAWESALLACPGWRRSPGSVSPAIKPSPDFNSFDPGYDTDLLAKVN